MHMFIISNVAGKINMESQMFFDKLAYLRTQSDIILLAQLIKNKLEFKRIKIIFQLQAFFRMIFFNHGNNAFRFIKSVVAKLPLTFSSNTLKSVALK